jgi:hypothetical protein
LFYKTAQSNTRIHKSSKQSRFDNILYKIGLAIGPRDFQRAHLRYVLLLKQSTQHSNLLTTDGVNQGTLSSSYISSVNDISALSMPTINSTHNEPNQQQTLTYAVEHFVWLLKIAFWSCMWGVLCILAMTFTRTQRNAINETTITGTIKYGDSFDCGILTWNIFMQSFYIIWNLIQLGIVVVVSRHARSDSLGMARELLSVQVISA